MSNNIWQQIFGTYSRRHSDDTYAKDIVSETLRNRVFMFLQDLFPTESAYSLVPDCYKRFLGEVNSRLRKRHGRYVLSSETLNLDRDRDTCHFLMTCEAHHFLDFVEMIFQLRSYREISPDSDSVVDTLNEIFRCEPAPYRLTRLIEKQTREDGSVILPSDPVEYRTFYCEYTYPKIIKTDDEAIFIEAIKPALSVLEDPAYHAANLEFREALEDYRKNDFDDCLLKCGSAFESVMKVICKKKGWPYNQSDTASPLLRKILENATLPSFFQTPLITIATMRNKLSSGHGSGEETIEVPRHVAQYAVNSTAAAILLLVHEVA